MGEFTFGTKSREKLHSVKIALIEWCHLTLRYSPVDFGVVDGVRTVEQQRELVRSGASRTMNSKHITGAAVDIVPWIGGRYSWEWEPYYDLAAAAQAAAHDLEIELRWGGVWDRRLRLLGDDFRGAVDAYADRFRRANPGRDPLLDGPHFELVDTDRDVDRARDSTASLLSAAP